MSPMSLLKMATKAAPYVSAGVRQVADEKTARRVEIAFLVVGGIVSIAAGVASLQRASRELQELDA